MVISLIGTSPSNAEAFPTERTGGARLSPGERKALSVQALGGSEPVSHLAERHKVSRKFVYQQAAKATDALDAAFATPGNDDQVIFSLPVTKDWLRQVVLAEVLLCHSSFRGVRELFSAVFDLPGPSEGTVHRIVQEAIEKGNLQQEHYHNYLKLKMESELNEMSYADKHKRGKTAGKAGHPVKKHKRRKKS